MNRLKIVAYLVSILSISGFVIGILALLDIVPLKYVWGGRLTDKSQLIPMEVITLVVNAFIIWVVGMRAGYFQPKFTQSVLRIVMLVLAVIMALNTLGNLVAKTNTEKYFAILTFISTLCFIYLYRVKPQNQSSK
jgi:hypothetical protein